MSTSRLPGPIDGPFTRPIAHRAMELVAAICTFALGRPVNLPPTVWPPKTRCSQN